MDKITIVVIIILLVMLGIFVGVQMSGNSTKTSYSGGYNSYPSQAGGGGCGR